LQNSELGQNNEDAWKPLIELASNPATSGYTLKTTMDQSPLLKHTTALASKDEGLKMIAAAMGARNARTDEKTDLNANDKYRKEMAPYEGTIQAANRANEIIDKIKAGKLKSTPTLATDLSSAVGSMFNQGKGATVYSMSHADMDSMQKRASTILGFLSGDAVDTLPVGQLDQLQKDIQSLRGAYLDGHDVAYNSFREGLPDRVKEKLDARFNKFRSMVTTAKTDPMDAKLGGTLGTGGADSLAGQNKPHPQDSAAVQWAKQNPKDPRAVKILQLNGM
jgi:hypothetical protein